MIREARASDAPSIARIYEPIVTNTIVSFEETAPNAEEIARRIERITANYPWIVDERDGKIAGYAYGSRWRERAAYRYSVEVTVYVDDGLRRSGVARALYGDLISRLSALGFHRAFAGISLPNDASVALHRSMGFELVGTYREAGYKFGRWIDVSWWQRAL